MSIDNILVRPQIFDRPPVQHDLQVVDMLVELSSRLMEDVLNDGPASQKISDAISGHIDAFINEKQGALAGASLKMKQFIDPFLQPLLDGEEVTGGVEAIFSLLNRFIEFALHLLEHAKTDQLIEILEFLIELLEQDLGISLDRIKGFFDDALSTAIDELNAAFLAGDLSTEATNNFLIGKQLAAVKRRTAEYFEELNLPDLDTQTLISLIRSELLETNWDETVDEMVAIVETIKDNQGIASSIVDIAFNTEVEGGFNTRSLDSEAFSSWYAFWFSKKMECSTERWNIEEEPFAEKMSFTNIPANWMEGIAYMGYFLGEAWMATYHIRKIDVNHKLLPGINIGYQYLMSALTALSKLIKGRGFVEFHRMKEDFGLSYLGLPLVPLCFSFLASLGDLFKYGRASLWGSFLKNHYEAFDDTPIPADTIRDCLFSILTLLNERGTEVEDSKNASKVKGIVDMSVILGIKYIIAPNRWVKIFRGQERYYLPFKGGIGRFIGDFLIAFVGIMTLHFIGWLVAALFSGKFSKKYWTTPKDWVPKAAAVYPFKYFMKWYSKWEGETKGGKLGFEGTITDEGKVGLEKIQFPKKYPSKFHSPYRLPFDKDKMVFCPQAHMGVASHNYQTGELYGVDFRLVPGDEVLAMRGGVVYRFRDDFPNGGADDTNNFISITHSNVLPEYDYDKNNNAVQTKGVYRNGKRFGVRHAFAALGVPVKYITGSKVPQGRPIIILGDHDGFFSMDHLHVHVETGSGIGDFPTLPFVFRDVRGDGVPKKWKYYPSQNEKKEVTGLSLYHPDYEMGRIRESGTDYVRLQESASDEGDYFEDCHLILSYFQADGTTIYEYKKILSYDGDSRRVTIEGEWTFGTPPIASTDYRIGGNPYGSTQQYYKKFTYLITNGTPIFPDNEEAYPLTRIGITHAPKVSGLIKGGGEDNKDFVLLDDKASDENNAYNDRHIAIRRDGTVIQIKKIRRYEIAGADRKIIIEGSWDQPLVPDSDQYEIGAPTFMQADNEERQRAFLCPDEIFESYSPVKMPFAPDEEGYYQYLTFNIHREDIV